MPGAHEGQMGEGGRNIHDRQAIKVPEPDCVHSEAGTGWLVLPTLNDDSLFVVGAGRWRSTYDDVHTQPPLPPVSALLFFRPIFEKFDVARQVPYRKVTLKEEEYRILVQLVHTVLLHHRKHCRRGR